MESDTRHPTDALQDALDDRLEPAKLAELEMHVASCNSCRRELEALRWTKSRTRSAMGLELAPGLESSLRAALDEEDRARGRAPSRSRGRLLRLAPWLAAAAVLAAAIWMGGRLWKSSIPDAVAEDFRAYRSNALPLETLSGDAAALEAYFVGESLPFPMRVFDLGMMEYQLVGASVRPVSGRVGALVAYRGSDGRLLLCRMYQGSVSDLPEPFDRRTNDGITFYLYRDSDLTLVFWQEGAVVCVLIGDGDPETVVQLAFAKALKV